jgi:hypothetical protein
MTTLSVVTPSNIIWGDIVEEDRLNLSSDLEEAQTEVSSTPSLEGVTSPPGTTSVSELLKHRVGGGASKN